MMPATIINNLDDLHRWLVIKFSEITSLFVELSARLNELDHDMIELRTATKLQQDLMQTLMKSVQAPVVNVTPESVTNGPPAEEKK